ncbi:hypothetical protein [Pectobacterium carotovorum]|nr:hypothetical protein [Pectobacterium carotovorum]
MKLWQPVRSVLLTMSGTASLPVSGGVPSCNDNDNDNDTRMV